MNELDRFHRTCAELLDAKDIGGYRYEFPEGLFGDRVHYIDEMHFHDSYDWAMLLVKEADKRGGFYFININTRLNALIRPYGNDGGQIKTLLLTPKQISQACLEVLKNG